MASLTFAVRDLFRRLSEDRSRKDKGFSPDIEAANAAMFRPFVTAADRQEALGAWMQRYQPCLFGKVAAAKNTLHYLFLDEDDLRESDQHISARIQQARRDWRFRSKSPRSATSTPAHGFVLSVVSPRICFAEPNDVLRQLSEEILNLWGCRSTAEVQGQVHWEDLFLENPSTGEYVRFSFSVDFFAAAGDGKWWHDHRVPAGIAFTANSVGHMRRFREWYEGKPDQRTWILERAMETINASAETLYGRATWLKPLEDGKPFITEIHCPFSNTRPKLAGFDWTRYAGNLHTDHAVRPEFFRSDPDKPTEAKYKEWLQDFQYLYDTNSRDYVRFVAGVTVSKEEVDEEIGRPSDFVSIASPPKRKPRREGEANIYARERAEIEALLEVCRAWRLTSDELAELAD